MKCTGLSKYIWSLKDQCVTPIDKWGIAKKVNSKVSPNYCKLCLTEKFFIIRSLDDCNLLNKRSELFSKFRHQIKLLLRNVKRIVLMFLTVFCIFFLSFFLFIFRQNSENICI